ncbi:MAG TPA: ATP-dependent protease ATPase subunit HslU [Candidatus Kapabacteria bacterium]|nr:ATP-dependent protease ATPase subunit HslU [Candidatus Kapabacteria bacterium]
MNSSQTAARSLDELTPSQIVSELDKHIVGQHRAKKSVAIALRNRWRRQQVTAGMREEIMPNNIIMIGPTGVGKTEIARRLARLARAPFLKVEATKFTEVGYVGRDVESIVRDLMELGIAMVRAEHATQLRERAEEQVEERLLDLLQPPVPAYAMPYMVPGLQTSITENDPARRTAEREQLRAQLRAGQLETHVVEMDMVDDSQNAQMGSMFSSLAGDEMGRNLQDLMSSMMPKRMVRRSAPISEARRMIFAEETSRLIDNEALIAEAVFRVENHGIVFLDEIDKIAGAGSTTGPDVSREGVQRDLLPIVEGSTVNTKYGPVKSDHILFIASGAFHVSKPSDLLPELQGRFPIRVELDSLTADDFIDILTIPENALVKQYGAILAAEGIELVFTTDGIEAIADTAAEVNETIENIGARRLHTVLTSLLEDILFEAPDNIENRRIEVTKEMVQRKLSPMIENRERSRYVL